VMHRARWVTLRARWVTLRACWVTLRARWVMHRARWVTLRARWVTLRARWVMFQHEESNQGPVDTVGGLGAATLGTAVRWEGDVVIDGDTLIFTPPPSPRTFLVIR
jgi:hypothetical protein